MEDMKRLLQMMIDKGATNFSHTMSFAVVNGHINIVRLMISKGAEMVNGLFRTVVARGHLEILKIFIEMRERTDAYDSWLFDNDQTISLIAAKYGHINIIKYMISKRVQIDYNTILIEGAKKGNKEMLMIGINNGATKYHLNSALAIAILYGQHEIINILLNLGINITFTCIKNASLNGTKEIIDRIFIYKNTKDLTTKNFNTLLCICSERGNLSMVKLMLENGADDYKGAIQKAIMKNHKEIIWFLSEKWKERK